MFTAFPRLAVPVTAVGLPLLAHIPALLLALTGHLPAALVYLGVTVPWLAVLLARARHRLAATRSELAATAQMLQQTRKDLARAETDPVTGLPVRRLAEQYIADTDEELSVALIDVDDMHTINNSNDHQYGDAYLAAVAARLTDVADDGDLVGRLGGDEFVLATRRSSWQLVDALLAAVHDPLQVAGRQTAMQVSIGVCQLPGGDVRAALGRADRAMLTAKRRRSVLELYDPARDEIPDPTTMRPTVRPRDRSEPPSLNHD